MEFLCYHRDRTGSTPLRTEMVEQHWTYMDRFAEGMVARGPTYEDDGTLTGSLHVVDLPDPASARVFAFDEPGYQAGAYRDVLLRRTRWEDTGLGRETARYLVLGFTLADAADGLAAPAGDGLVAGGLLLSDDGSLVVGAAALVGAADPEQAARALGSHRYDGVEVHRWRPGGRPHS